MNKTQPNALSVETYLGAIASDARQADCRKLAALMTEATGETPLMWGTSIVGFGSYHYKYESGREGDSCTVGFSSRKKDITLYLVAEFPQRDELLSRLGKHDTGKGCVYVSTLDGIDSSVLKTIVRASYEQRKLNHEIR